MTDFVDWEDVETTTKGRKSGGSGGGGKFLRLEANTTHTVRPVHKPIMFYKIFNRVGKRLNSANVEEDTKIPNSYPDLKPSRRFAIVVFDRDDDNKLKILEFGSTVFEAFRYYKKMAKAEPGGNDGGDFEIKVDCPNGKKDRDTTYNVEFKERKEFTDEERAIIKESKEEFALKTIFAAMSDEDAEKRLFATGDERGNDDSKKEEKVGAGSSKSDDDDFGW